MKQLGDTPSAYKGQAPFKAGDEIEIYWEVDRTWYSATVLDVSEAYDSADTVYNVQFDESCGFPGSYRFYASWPLRFKSKSMRSCCGSCCCDLKVEPVGEKEDHIYAPDRKCGAGSACDG